MKSKKEAAMPDPARSEARQIGLQFSLYPLRQEKLQEAIEAAVRAAANEGIEVDVGRLSSSGMGDEDTVFKAVRAAFDAARALGPAVMVVTLASDPASPEAVAETQTAAR
jgi:hypothetical protein